MKGIQSILKNRKIILVRKFEKIKIIYYILKSNKIVNIYDKKKDSIFVYP